MELSNFFDLINGQGMNFIFIKIILILFSVLYILYTLVISKQVKIMDKTLQDKYNWIIILVTSIQVTISIILLILTILLF
jgi:hypothetical protein